MKKLLLIISVLFLYIGVFGQTNDLDKSTSVGSGVDSITPVPLKTATSLTYDVVSDNDTLKKVLFVDIDTVLTPPTTVNAATYDLLRTDNILHVTYTTTGAVTSLTLPTAQVEDGRIITIKDGGLNASTYSITIDTEGSETIDGAATLVISTDGESVDLYSDGSDWFIK